MFRSRVFQLELSVLVLCFLGSCGNPAKIGGDKRASGKSTTVKVASSTFTDTTSWMSAEAGARESASSEVEVISTPRIEFGLTLDSPEDPIKKAKPPKVTIEIYNPKGALAATARKEGKILLWAFDLKDGDGRYELQGQVEDSTGKKQTWSKRFRLDTSAPVIRTSAHLTAPDSQLGRTIELSAFVADASAVACRGQLEPGVSVGLAPVLFDLSDGPLEGESPNRETMEKGFHAKGVPVPDDYPNSLLVRVICHDTFKHQGEFADVTAFGQPDLGFQAKIARDPAIPYESRGDASAVSVPFLRTRTASGGVSTALELNLAMINKRTLKELEPQVLSREKPRLQVVLSNFEVKDIAELAAQPESGRKIFLRKAMDTHMAGTLPSSLTGALTLWASVIHVNESDGSEKLLGSQPLPVYIEEHGHGLNVQWKMPAQFIPAKKGASIPLLAEIKPQDGTGAPLKGVPKLEYTLNNDTWTEIPVQEWQVQSGDIYSFQAAYPLDEEKPMRFRLKASDAADNETVSGRSPNLVGPAGHSLSSGEACAGSGLRLSLASSFLCRKDVPGYGVRYFFPITVQNSGTTPFDIAPASESLCGSLYCVGLTITRGTQNVYERLAADKLRDPNFKNHEMFMMHYGSFQKGEIDQYSQLSLSVQANGPNCTASPAPGLILKSPTLPSTESVFECD